MDTNNDAVSGIGSESVNFRLKPVAQFLDGKHNFIIPSYQRGYRWDIKQVKDLLRDLCSFADTKNKELLYCLQPIVVEEKNGDYFVIDGQQRLTTLYLILNYIKKEIATQNRIKNAPLYRISYETRKKLDIDNPNPNDDIDSFYINQAKNTIEKWFDVDDTQYELDTLIKTLFTDNPDTKQVKFIWYMVDSHNETDSIRTFNNLNRGKIKLTNAELIKALFVLKAQNDDKDNNSSSLHLNQLAYEWDDIEKKLHDDNLWQFLTNPDYNPATRIDIIFDILTAKTVKHDADYSYRKFQAQYDADIESLSDAWDRVKKIYQTFIYWYEDNTIYHYIGYLICNRQNLGDIFNKCENMKKTKIKEFLKNEIRDVIKKDNDIKESVDRLTYSNEKEMVRKILLFFNIETCVKEEDASGNYFKFSFNDYKNEGWDIEHVSSQTTNPLTDSKDQISWISYLDNVYDNDPEWGILKKEAKGLIDTLKKKQPGAGQSFVNVYLKIQEYLKRKAKSNNDFDEATKDTLGNLVLLDAGTNRGYGNAMFPGKRDTIIEKDKEGKFIPPCTRNLFLKYYTQYSEDASEWNIYWNNKDRVDYLAEIHKKIDWIWDDKPPVSKGAKKDA
jgi:hypothetical protein